jgi:hypothetical protein
MAAHSQAVRRDAPVSCPICSPPCRAKRGNRFIAPHAVANERTTQKPWQKANLMAPATQVAAMGRSILKTPTICSGKNRE